MRENVYEEKKDMERRYRFEEEKCVLAAIGRSGLRARRDRNMFARKDETRVLFDCWLMCGDTCCRGRETAQGVAK